MLRGCLRTALLLLAGGTHVAGAGGPGSAQTIDASLAGTVSLEGTGLPGIAVTLRGEGIALSTETDAAGRYEFSRLTPGTYTVALHDLPTTHWSPQPEMEVTVTSGKPAVVDLEVRRPSVIEITVIPDSARVRVSPDPLYIVPGQRIVWRLDGALDPDSVGAFSIHFEPFSPLLYRSMRTPRGDTILGQVRWIILPGKYRYFVAVWYNGLIYTEDPELIDDNGVEPPHPLPGGTG